MALAPKTHYTVDEKQKSILITDEGYEAAEDVLGVRRNRSRQLLLRPNVCCKGVKSIRVPCCRLFAVVDAAPDGRRII